MAGDGLFLCYVEKEKPIGVSLAKNIKLQTVPPLMPSKSLSVRLSGIKSASNGLAEAQVVILYIFWIKYKYIDQSLVCVAYSCHTIYEYTTHYQNDSFFNWDISHNGATGI